MKHRVVNKLLLSREQMGMAERVVPGVRVFNLDRSESLMPLDKRMRLTLTLPRKSLPILTALG